MKEEIQVIKERKVWDLVPKPANGNVIGCRWVYTLNQDEKGVIVRYKVRLVAQGFGQIQGIHYDEIFNPVVNFSIIRMCFSVLVCKQKWRHSQLDIKCAYLYASLQDTIFMSQPQGFVDPNKPDHVCHLNKALYGLHQSGRERFYEIHSVLENLSFKKLESTSCVYVYRDNVVLLLYVDDIVLFAKTDNLIKDVKKCLSTHLDLKVLGKTRKLLGVEFEEMGNELFIHQSEYIHKVCEKYQCFNYPVTSLPIAVGIVLSKAQCPSTEVEISEMSKFSYRNLLGCLSFISGRKRPDIGYAVNILSQFQSNPGLVHWNILIKLLGYVAQTKAYKLKLSEINNLNINCYNDADFDRISIGGLILFIDNSPIIWKTFKQKCVSLSTMKSEYVSLCESAKELVWIIRIFKEFEILNVIKTNVTSYLFCDNQAAIDFSKSPV
ncbi:Retrovirus-related Pol polyprotein from transposon TNT 1-94 [Araneus ventricosus]|uniref:Retrovirus-related Pol polyprotein from transposon TNT 1-94 n=1 Tax=Araneus ventricosus TaxID=182803 RepID=A0A4Y2S3T4_ARAVE|nr:Retrovirus-related Pol polyprotein from transposon TNT 1-94 [Araneus ventricosus]GBN81932.1 Retrovirus-related Pol polyprotein from transposon TNT 1-94 [Araneus ventricosus]GBN81938.1 Retrovirus-related Pol polyprotein from transposon TNT 1-94 [Araneus ventricosus]GBN81948.1 Retrovirus-related Pol polyprotein from transposon TNT 1-94 [Araneus ventricosus]